MRNLFTRRRFLEFDTPIIPLYDDVSAMYTLRQPAMSTLWTKPVLFLRRTGSVASTTVYFDSNGKISLNSPVGVGGDLGTWVGSNDAYVNTWYAITPDNIQDNTKRLGQSSNSKQPKFIDNGVIITKNGEPAIDFLSSLRFLQAAANTDLDSGNDFTVFSVSNNDVISSGEILTTSNTTAVNNYRIQLYNDNRSNKLIAQLRATAVNYFTNYISEQNTTNQKLLTTVITASDFKSYFNSDIQGTTNWSGVYTNNKLKLGSNISDSVSLDGTIQEIIIFPSDKTTDLDALNTDINDYYTIY